jgi:carbonic anhydrase
MRYSEFKISYAIGVGGVRALVIAGHNNCGMVGLHSRREQFVAGLVDAGWTREQAEEHFNAYAPMFEIGNAAEFVREEARRLNNRYPKVIVAPMMYSTEDGRLYLVPE